MEFFGIGLPELVVILVLTLIVVGPQRLPEVAAQIARTIREFRRYSSGVTQELLDAVKDLEREYQELRGELRSVGGELREKAESFGRELTDVSEEARQKLNLESAGPGPKVGPAQIALPGDNGKTAAETAVPAANEVVEAEAHPVDGPADADPYRVNEPVEESAT
jgi:Tat protein translocase TatB subunit